MKGTPAYLFLIVAALLTACQQSPPSAAPGEVRVVSIADGDTFTGLTAGKERIRIRLEGIDCPERGQAFSKNATEALSELVFDQTVRLEESSKDRYGRTIAKVYLSDGRCVNEEMIRLGMAWHFKRYSDDARWAKLEKEARKARRGLWADKSPTPPWEWRKGK
jgi:micrococcal nuclease